MILLEVQHVLTKSLSKELKIEWWETGWRHPCLFCLVFTATKASGAVTSPPPRVPRRKGRAASDRGQIPSGFFVYGTLRPDDDSGASWTKSFTEGLEAEVAYLPGASLYIDGSYPAVCFEETACSVRGMLLRPPSTSTGATGLLAAKLAEADKIEGYPDLYSRTVATVLTDKGVTSPAYVYHRTGKFDRASRQRIADGDWLSRKRWALRTPSKGTVRISAAYIILLCETCWAEGHDPVSLPHFWCCVRQSRPARLLATRQMLAVWTCTEVLSRRHLRPKVASETPCHVNLVQSSLPQGTVRMREFCHGPRLDVGGWCGP